MEKPTHTYDKWDGVEPESEVFEMIKSGKMNKEGFRNWVSQLKVEETRYLFPM